MNTTGKQLIIYVVILLAVAITIGLFLIHQNNQTADGQDTIWPAVRVNGQIYYCLHTDDYEPALSVEESRIDGYITSCVDSSQYPTEDNQSNYPTAVDCPYAEINGVLLLRNKYNDSWIILRPYHGD
ncbi:MAG: hypothetical protein IJB11_01830 [Oscillospiraceae bacterium]|nr:hypothetical protein [Oscillospiraceae bacterium]